MRNLHPHIYQKYGKECVKLLCKWEDLVKKMADFGNYRRFTLRFLKAGVTLVSVRLKNNTRTSRSYKIIRRAEKQLLNERIRCINTLTPVVL